MKRKTLRGRLNRVLFDWLLLFLIASGIMLAFSSSGLRQSVLEERQLLARTVAHSLDGTVSVALRDLGRLASEITDFGPDDARRLRAFRFESPFRHASYILDDQANLVLSDPPGARPISVEGLGDKETVTSVVTKADGDSSATVAIVQPFRLEGVSYALVSEMDPLHSMVSTFVRDLAADPGTHIAVIDAFGVVIGAQDPRVLLRKLPNGATYREHILSQRSLLSDDYRCELCVDSRAPPRALTAMTPLRFAPWGVMIQEHQSDAFAGLNRTRRGMLIAGVMLGVTAVLLSRALARSVVSPIQELSRKAEGMRSGDLVAPIAVSGDHEVKVLAGTLDDARASLGKTLGELKDLNEDLERQVAERTELIAAKYRDLQLLHAVAQLSTREREPLGIARSTLRLLADHFEWAEAAIVIRAPDGSRETVTEPAAGSVPANAQRRNALHQGKVQAELLLPAEASFDESILDAVEHQLAVLLREAHLWKRTVSQDKQRRVLLRKLLNATEDERRRLARELHDEIAQLLTVIQLSLEEVDAEGPPVEKAKKLLVDTQKEIHRIIHDLRPSALDDLGLAAAMQSYAHDHLERNGVSVSLEIEEGLPSRPEIEIATFRIYQEIVTNILRHAHAENVSIELYEQNGSLLLAVEDDGVGFDPRGKSGGAGITGMRERAALLNGHVGFDSEPGMGAHVALEIPIQ